MKNVLVLGASSGMARALLKMIAGRVRLVLAGNDPDSLKKIAADLELRNGARDTVVMDFDAGRHETHRTFVDSVMSETGRIDEVFLFFGTMVNEETAHQCPETAVPMMMINYVGAVSVLEHLAPRIEKGGVITALSSVAGDRGRSSNYLYGSTKAGLTAYLSGLRARLSARGVHVVTVKPGFVDTPMTAGLKKGLLTSSPERVARGILKAAARRRNTVYVPGFWALIMLIIIHLPEAIFKKVKF